MNVNINFSPTTLSWEAFVNGHPPFSIALDGFVVGPPRFALTPRGPFRSFDHHEFVDRSCTLATCEQVRRAILLGLFEAFQRDGVPYAEIHINDYDEDVCMATWLLQNPHRASEPLVRTLCQIEDLLDASSGMMPLPHNTEMLRKARWVFAPCWQAKQGSQLSPLEVIYEVHQRINAFTIGKAKEDRALNGGFTKISTDPSGWIAYFAHGPMAKAALVAAGFSAGIEVSRPEAPIRKYVLWRRSEYITSFPVGELLRSLAEVEPGWGGSSIIGGSPRHHSSRFSTEELIEFIREVLSDV